MRCFQRNMLVGIGLVLCVLALGCGKKSPPVNEGRLVMTPEAFGFPTLSENSDGIVRSIEILNEGTEPAKLFEFKLNAASEDFTVFYEMDADGQTVLPFDDDDAFSVDLEPGDTLTLYLKFNPEDVSRAPMGDLSFRTDARAVTPRSLVDPDDSRLVHLPILGQSAVGELRITPSEVDFGRTARGEYKALPVTVTNVGTLPVNFSSYEVFGSSDCGLYIDPIPALDAREQMLDENGADARCQLPEDMTIERDPRGEMSLMVDPDGDGAEGLNPGKAFTLCITFKTALDTPQRGGINIITDAEPAISTVNVRGNAGGPCLSIEPNPLDFGAGLVNANNERQLTLVSCGVLPVTIEALEVIDDGGGVFSIVEDSLPATPPFALPGAEPTSPATPQRAISINFLPTDLIEYNGQLRVLSNDSEKIVDLQGRGFTNECPVADVPEADRVVRVRPLDSIVLDGSLSSDPDGPDMKPTGYRWTVVTRPTGSTSIPVESFRIPSRPQDGGPDDDERTPFANFFVDLTGTYEIELTVFDDLGFEAPSATCPQDPIMIRVEAVPEEDLTVELVWNTPGDANQTDGMGTDLDLRLAHPQFSDWNDTDWVCYHRQPVTDWGNGNDQIAKLNIDDTDGAGPEKISIAAPENTSMYDQPYRVAVHYFSDGSGLGFTEGFGPSTATVRITLAGGIVQEFSRELENWDLWEVAAIVWTPNDRRANEIDTPLQEFPPPGF